MSDPASRILIYSHDSYGLGHLRRCRAIAHSLVTDREDRTVLIISGSPLVGSFSFHPRVEFIRVPGVVKLGNENYAAQTPGISIDDLMAMRSAIIAETAKVFTPDLFIVDKEPLGLRGEVERTLWLLRAMGKQLVLGIRDVMDEPERMAEEWERKRAIPAIEQLYDHIWIYGLPEICDPLEGVGLSHATRATARFTGYLRRATTPSGAYSNQIETDTEPYILVTTGGGADGEALVDAVISAYEHDPTIEVAAHIVLGPFMGSSQQIAFMERAARLPKVQAITFEANIESMIEGAVGIVAMGGYNTFCEVLSFDKRALIVPRTRPRVEQYVRASRAANLGLVRMLEAEEAAEPGRMASAIKAIAFQPKPSSVSIPGLLEGLSAINSLVDECLARQRSALVPSRRSAFGMV